MLLRDDGEVDKGQKGKLVKVKKGKTKNFKLLKDLSSVKL